jgi:hypothetical protein
MEDTRNVYKTVKERDHSEEVGVEGRKGTAMNLKEIWWEIVD